MKNLCVNINEFDNAKETEPMLQAIKEIPGVLNADWLKEADRQGDKAYHNRFRNVAWVELANTADEQAVITEIDARCGKRVRHTNIILDKEDFAFSRKEKKVEDLTVRVNRILYDHVYSIKRLMDANHPTPHSGSTRSYRKLDKSLTKLVGWFGVHLVILDTKLSFQDEKYTHMSADFSTALAQQANEIAKEIRDIMKNDFILIRDFKTHEIMELPGYWDAGRLGESDLQGIREFIIETTVTMIPHRYNTII